MKIKDYFLKAQKQARLDNIEDFTKFIDTLPDGEVPDVVNNLLEANFLTRERASVDPDILKKVKAEVYNGVDAVIHGLVGTLPKTDQDAIKSEMNSNKKIQLLESVWKKQHDELKKTAPDAANINQEHVNTIKDLTSRLEAERIAKEKVVADQDKVVKEVTAKAEKELKSYKIKNDITGRLSQFEFAKEFTENPVVKKTIFEGILNNIVKNELDYDEQGQMVVQEIVNGVPKPKFLGNSNEIVTVEKLLESETSPYLKRNNSEGQQTGVEKTITRPSNTQPKTLAAMRAAEV